MRILKKAFLGLLGVALLASPTVMAKKRYGGTATLMVRETNAHVRNFNPFNVEIGFYQGREWIYEPLYIFNVMHPGKDFPWLATKYTYSKDLKSVTFTLRKGVKWSDGEEFDADDVIFTTKLKQKFPALLMQVAFGKDGTLKRVEKVSKYKVRFHLRVPNSLAHLKIGKIYPVPEHIWKKIKDPINYADPNPVGTGPFTKIKQFKPTLYTICKNPNYWQKGKPYLDCLRFPQFGSNEQVLAAAARGKVDWFGGGVTNPEREIRRKNKGMKYWFPADGNTNLQLNSTKKPFNDPEFRKAMSVAINRQDLLDIATFGLTTESVYPIGIGDFYKSWHDHKRLKKYKYLMKYDPKLAKKILDKAGYVDKNGDGWRDYPNGKSLSFKLSVPSGWTDWVNSMQMISENLQDIGINAHLHTPDEGAWFDAIAGGDFDVYIMWVNLASTPWDTYEQMFNPSYMVKGGLRDQSMHQMRLPKVQRYLDEFTQTTSANKQRDLIGKVQVEVAENLPVIGLFANPGWYVYNEARLEGWSTEENPYVRPQVWGGIYERLVHVLNLSLKPGVK